MKKLYFLFTFIFASLIGFSQGSEDFENHELSGSSYVDGSFTGNNGVIWDYIHVTGEQTFPINGKGILLRRSNEPSSISATLSGGIENFSVNTRKAFTGNAQRRIELVINGSVVAQFEPTFGAGADDTVVPFVVENINIPGDFTLALRLYGATGNQQLVIDDLVWTGFEGAATPSINISGSIPSLDYFEGNGPSEEGTLDVSGLNLNENITVTAPTNFEVSLSSGTGFGSSVSVAQTDGTAPSTTIYVRLQEGLPSNTYSGDVTASSSGATSSTAPVNGTVAPADPQITVSGSVNSLTYSVGNGPSTSDSFSVEAIFLTENITVTAPASFQVSLSAESGFGNSVSVPQTSGTVSSTEVYVRLVSGLAIGAYSGDVTIASSGATPQIIAVTGNVVPASTNALVLSGVYDGPLAGGTPKGIEILVLEDIADLSIYGLGSANNGGGTDGVEFTFPAISASAQQSIYVSSEAPNFEAFFGFSPDFTTGAMGINGDDAIELFENGIVIDTFGEITYESGATLAWDYRDGWAKRNSGTGPDGATFVLANWTFSGVDQLEGGTTNDATTLPFPLGTLSTAEFNSNNFSLYPNPVSNGLVTINTTNSDAINVFVYDVLGKQVKNETIINNTLNVGDLNTGIYILKMTQNQATVTKKLIIK
ncbi:T9SS type A sorting domain-containing protein [Paucihalobacter sp.]|uniref:T9SS type A sorting domain-containing protein n=1 Tax=Paucihalobacter sp. TaxID=2850405 RepID=UPI002FE3A101